METAPSFWQAFYYRLSRALFDTNHKRLLEMLQNIRERNALFNGYSPSFIYRSKSYHEPLITSQPVGQRTMRASTVVNPANLSMLHPTLFESMNAYLEKKEEQLVESESLRLFLSHIQPVTSNEEDVLEIFPDALRSTIKTAYESTAYTAVIEAQRIRPEKLAQFIQDNQKGIDLIRTRLTINLIDTH